MPNRCDCCGCVVADDYGTSVVTGSGTADDPYQVSPTDTSFVRPMVRVTQDTQSIPNNTPTVVTYDSAVFDTNTMWSGANPSRITFQTAGLYVFGSRWDWAFNVTGLRNAYWAYTNLAAVTTTLIDAHRDATGSGVNRMNLPYQWYFQAGEYIALEVEQSSGGNLSVGPVFSWACWLGNF